MCAGDLRGVPVRSFLEIAAELRQVQSISNISCVAKGIIMDAEKFREVFADVENHTRISLKN